MAVCCEAGRKEEGREGFDYSSSMNHAHSMHMGRSLRAHGRVSAPGQQGSSPIGETWGQCTHGPQAALTIIYTCIFTHAGKTLGDYYLHIQAITLVLLILTNVIYLALTGWLVKYMVLIITKSGLREAHTMQA